MTDENTPDPDDGTTPELPVEGQLRLALGDSGDFDDGDVWDLAGEGAPSEVDDDEVDDDELDSDAVGGRWRRVGWVVLALVVAGLALRLSGLADRPFHHDEGLDAWWSWRFLNKDYPGYDPVYHGPLRFYITAFFFWVFGESDTTARLLAALSGAAAVALPWLWRRDLGPVGTPAAVALVAISPSMLYFSRVGREDTFFLALTFAMVLVLMSFIRQARPWHPTVFFVLLVCAWAVKESVFLTLFVFGAFGMVLLAQQLLIVTPDGTIDPAAVRNVQRATLLGGLVMLIATLWWIGIDPGGAGGDVSGAEGGLESFGEAGGHTTIIKLGAYGALLGALIVAGFLIASRRSVSLRDIPLFRAFRAPGWVGWLVGAGTSAALFLALFTQFFTDWEGDPSSPAKYNTVWNGLYSGLEYWLNEQDTVRGDSRWQYYLVVIPAYEWCILLLALVGIAVVVRRPTLVGQALVWWGVASLAVYSWAGERMPWLIVHPLLPFILLAGLGVQQLWQLRHRPLLVSGAVLVLVPGLAWTAYSSYQASYVRGGEPEELFVQAGQATPQVREWTERLSFFDRLVEAELGRHVTVGIDSDTYWPYGWYLRDFPGGAFASYEPDDETLPDKDIIFLWHGDFALGDRLEGYVSLPYEHRWWWVPDFDASPGQWAAWLWDREPWQRIDDDPGDDTVVDRSDCPGSLTGRVYIRQEVYDLYLRYYGGVPPEGAPPPGYDGPCARDGW